MRRVRGTMNSSFIVRLPILLYSLLWEVFIGGSLFGGAGRFAIPPFWEYLAVGTLASLVGSLLLDQDLMKERLSPGGQRLDPRYWLLAIPAVAHWIFVGLDTGRSHWSSAVPRSVQLAGVIGLGAADGVITWAMYAA